MGDLVVLKVVGCGAGRGRGEGQREGIASLFLGE